MSPLPFGALVVSLDFELYWGVRDVRTLEDYGENLLAVRRVVPALLSLFDRYQIHATWATVGFLFSRTKEELLSFAPKVRPQYQDSELGAYAHIASIGAGEADDPYHYAPSLIQTILRHPSQELGSHTFSHYYCLEQGQDAAAFEADMEASSAIMASRGVALRSLVFPRNQLNPGYLPSCRRMNLLAYRGNPPGWMYSPDPSQRPSAWKRALRLCDAYLNLSAETSYAPEGCIAPVNVRASRFLRPWSRPLRHLEGLRLRRIRRELSSASRRGWIYHLWWHPHNFGSELAENLSFLESILRHFDGLRRSSGMESLSMGECAARLAGGF
jgi:peptidoglycan/xylan/chitin deacetylase (PgdA/CDA1 family)